MASVQVAICKQGHCGQRGEQPSTRVSCQAGSIGQECHILLPLPVGPAIEDEKVAQTPLLRLLRARLGECGELPPSLTALEGTRTCPVQLPLPQALHPLEGGSWRAGVGLNRVRNLGPTGSRVASY